MIILIICFIFAGVPFGLLLTKIAGLGDIRNIGSGNIGATNVLRTGNKKIAAATLLLDLLKGYLIVTIPPVLGYDFSPEFLGFIAVIGHIFSVFLKFKGGKGVATGLGTLLAINPILGLSILGIWLLTLKLFKISFIAAITASIFMPLIAYILKISADIPMIGFMALIVILAHHQNIKQFFKKNVSIKYESSTSHY
jgi:acyl phosphate:glycerol-3-phosphate acyltransferase